MFHHLAPGLAYPTRELLRKSRKIRKRRGRRRRRLGKDCVVVDVVQAKPFGTHTLQVYRYAEKLPA
ncbi:hypothetical protein L218DRAFT_962737 [Marasmius fiardii PR-910]|nr:hypothetical protein L218DRAFT_962737 [Marasmius fiardii PR-910]